MKPEGRVRDNMAAYIDARGRESESFTRGRSLRDSSRQSAGVHSELVARS
jgi:hypothetical protein